MLIPKDELPEAGRAPEITAIDVSALGRDDLVNVILQRSEVIADHPAPGAAVHAWTEGDSGPLLEIVDRLGHDIAHRALAAVRAEFDALIPVLDPVLMPTGKSRRRLADIGCGYAFFELFAARRYGCRLALIDLESNDRRHFGFKEAGAAYSSLEVARRFLKANSVPAQDIRALNPQHKDPTDLPAVHAAISFLACGFHFPVDTYIPFFMQKVKRGGRVLVDLRARRAAPQVAAMEKLGQLETLPGPPKTRRVLLERG
jgi:SAM-dependent methyltransferase